MGKTFLVSLFCICFCINISSQNIYFKHIGLKDGLSSNNVADVIEDQHGNLLIATDDGLNKYDGNQISKIPDLNIKTEGNFSYKCLLKTSENKIYVGTTNGLYYFNENQVLTKSIIKDTFDTYSIFKLIEDKVNRKIYMITEDSYYCLSKNNEWVPDNWFKDTFTEGSLTLFSIEANHFLLSIEALPIFEEYKFRIHDLRKKDLIFEKQMKTITSATMTSENTVLICLTKGVLLNYNLDQNKLVNKIVLKEEINGVNIASFLRRIKNIDETYVGICTNYNGFKLLNKNKLKIEHFKNNQNDVNSLYSNQTSGIIKGSNGNVYLTHFNAGISLFNFNTTRIEQLPVFVDDKNISFQGSVNCISQNKEGKLLIGTADRIITYDPNTKISSYDYYRTYVTENNSSILLTIKSIYKDFKDRYWICTHSGGIILTDRNLKIIKRYSAYRDPKDEKINSNWIWQIKEINNKIWVCGSQGLYQIDPISLKVDSLESHPVLSVLPRSRCKTVFEDKRGNIWIGYEFIGLFRYNEKNKTLKSYFENKELPFKHCNEINEDHFGNIYIAHEKGFSIIDTKDKWKNYNTTNGLRFQFVQGFINDSLHNVWIGNHTSLIKYNPIKKDFKYFEENYGMGKVSLIRNASLKFGDFIIWGTDRGLIKFNPYLLDKTKPQLNVYINEVITKDKTIYVGNGKEITLQEGNGLISILFSGVNLFGSKKVNFQYMMDGYTDQWTNTSAENKINFASLPAGSYTLRVKGSIDGAEWMEAKYPLKINIKRVFWKSPLFLFSFIGLFSLAFLYWYRQKLKAESKQSDLKKQLAELEVKAIRAQMNPHFVFNALNSIQYFTYIGEVDKANEYLSDFAKLMRLVLQQSKDGVISLDDEIDLLTLYLKIEALRFDNDFTFSVSKGITIDDSENYILPSMIIQPFAENAIKHGLVPKVGTKHLEIVFSIKDNNLLCVIEDNGIGITASKTLFEKQTMKVPHQSMGMDLVKKRLEMIHSQDDRKPTIDIIEKTLENDKGTKVTINLPI